MEAGADKICKPGKIKTEQREQEDCLICSVFILQEQFGRGGAFGDLTEVWRTRPERTMSGVVRGMAESSVPLGRLSWRGNPVGMNCCGDRLHSLECASVLSS